MSVPSYDRNTQSSTQKALGQTRQVFSTSEPHSLLHAEMASVAEHRHTEVVRPGGVVVFPKLNNTYVFAKQWQFKHVVVDVLDHPYVHFIAPPDNEAAVIFVDITNSFKLVGVTNQRSPKPHDKYMCGILRDRDACMFKGKRCFQIPSVSADIEVKFFGGATPISNKQEDAHLIHCDGELAYIAVPSNRVVYVGKQQGPIKATNTDDVDAGFDDLFVPH